VTDAATQNHNASCSTGYSANGVLCSSCAFDFSHADLSGRCDKCPAFSLNLAVALCGGLAGVVGIVVFVKLTLSDGGNVEVADGIMAITLSFVQLLSLLTSFPIAWPGIFITIFAIGGAVTVLGQHLVNLKCLFPSNTEADVFYNVLLM